MSELNLIAQTRNVLGKLTKQLRHSGKIPAVVYGHGLESRPLEIDSGAFQKIWQQAGTTTLIDLAIGLDNPVKVLIQAVQLDPKTHRPIHIDFHQVKMTEKISAEIPLVFNGESAAVKEQGGVLVKSLAAIKVECLPADLVHELIVDISALKTFEDAIRVSDLSVPASLNIMENADEVVATVSPPRTEAELESLEEKVEEKVEAVGTVEKEKKGPEEETEAAKEDNTQSKNKE